MDTSRDSGRYSPSSTSTLSRSSSFRSGSRTSLIRRNQSISAKQIRFYRNGDKYFGGLKLAVSTERYKEFDSLLAELSVKLDLPSGAVRFVFNAEDGSLITDISQLQYGIPYVCCSSNTLRQLDEGYGKQNSSNWSMNRQKSHSRSTNALTSLEGNTPRDAMVHVRNMRDFIKPKLVTVIKNGKPPQKKVTMLLNQKTAVSYNQVLDHLSAKGSLGKVDKLYAVDGKLVRDLRDLFDEDTVFIAFSSNEKFPEEGIELDPKSYRITPYRELKRPSNLKRSNSLRSTNGKFRDENENMNAKGKASRPKSIGPGSKLMNTAPKSPRGKITGSKKMNVDVGKDELYPTAVFERESSDSALQFDDVLKNRMHSKRERPSIHGFYKIGKIIGDGNFAVVRECRHRKTGKDFALKAINKAKVRGKEHMIENEILILRRVKHPHIVELIEEFETPKEILLVMELVAGGDLFDAIVEATKFTEQNASHMIRDLASAVKYLHSMQIVHRDIKPENLLVVNNSNGNTSLKLADFGLSIEVKSPMFLVCGTPTYVAPEILDESGYGLKVDIWAIGVITYILLCGFPPFRSQNQDQEELFDKILRGDFEYLAPFWDEVSDSARDLINRLLVVDVNRRYDSDDILEHPWIKGHTAKNKNLQEKLSNEIAKNFNHRRRLRGVALAIQTVIYLSNVIRRKRAEIRQTHSCVEFSQIRHFEQNQVKECVLEQRPAIFTSRSSSSSFEESRSFYRDDSFEQPTPASFPGSPARKSSISSRIPRPKPTTTPRQHIEDIRKSISNSKQKTYESTHQSRIEQLNAVGAAYQKVYGDKGNRVSDLKPPSVTLRNRPSSAKETSSYRRSSVTVAQSQFCSLPTSPKHEMISALAPGVKKRMPLSKCVSVEESVRKRSGSVSSSISSSYRPSAISRRPSVTENKKSSYRASYPNRNSNFLPQALDSITVKPRFPKNVASKSTQDDKIEKDGDKVSIATARRSSIVKRPTSNISSGVNDRDNPKRLKDTNVKSIKNSEIGICDKENSSRRTESNSSSDEGNISIVTKTNKTENIKISHGKTVDKSVETSTTVSVTFDGDKKKASVKNPIIEKPSGLGRSLLTKVKQLAEEIETLAMFTSPEQQEQADKSSVKSYPHSCSMPVLHDNVVIDADAGDDSTASSDSTSRDASNRSEWDRDCFSETEYLSLDTKSSRHNNDSANEDDIFF